MWVDARIFAPLFLRVVSPLVLAHELGHFMAARAAGVHGTALSIDPVQPFSIKSDQVEQSTGIEY